MIKHYKFILLIVLFFNIFFNSNEKLYAQYSITGHVYYSDNLEPVIDGYVYAIVYDYDIGAVVLEDSAALNLNGSYVLTTACPDSVLLYIGWLPTVGNEDFPPTYYPSTIDWTLATKIFPPDNPQNIDIYVQRIIPLSDRLIVTGTVLTVDSIPVSGAVMIAKQDTIFRNVTVTDSAGNFTLDSLSGGTFTIIAGKIGYALDSNTIILSGSYVNSNHVNISLKKAKLIRANLSNKVLRGFYLDQNFPNPFNPATTIRFNVPKWASIGYSVKLTIYDILGREVKILIDQSLKPGSYELSWDASSYSSGIYFYELRTVNFRDVKKMVLIK
jgi:hypothetical protein